MSNYIKPLVDKIDGSDYNNRIGKFNFSKSDKEEPDELYALAGDKSIYYNPAKDEVNLFDSNVDMYSALKEDLEGYEYLKTEGRATNRKQFLVKTFAGKDLYFNPETLKKELEKFFDTTKVLTDEQKDLKRSFNGSKTTIGGVNDKRSFVVYAPDFIQKELNDVDSKKQQKAREDFLFFKERLLSFHRDPSTEIEVQNKVLKGYQECEISTVHVQEGVSNAHHFHMKVGSFLVDDQGNLVPKKIRWDNTDDSTGYTKALSTFIKNDPALRERFGDKLASYTVLPGQGSATDSITLPVPQSSPTPPVSTQTQGEEEQPFDDESPFDERANKAVQSILDTDVEEQAKQAMINSNILLKPAVDTTAEDDLGTDTRGLLDSITKQINEVNRMYSDVVKEKIIPLIHANNALVTSQELVLVNKKISIANQNNISKIGELEKEKSLISSELIELKETNKTQASEISAYIEKNTSLASENITLKESLASRESEIADLTTDNEKLEKSLEHNKNRYKQAVSIASQRKSEINVLNNKIESLSSDVSNKDIEINSLKESITDLKEQHKKDLLKIDTDNALEIEKIKKDHEKEVKKLNDSISDLNSTINSLNSNLALKDSTINAQSTLIANNDNLISSQAKTISAKDVEISQLQSDIAKALGFEEQAKKVPELEKELKETKEVKDESGKLLKEFLKIAGDHIPKEVFEELVKKSGTSLIDSKSIDRIYKGKNNLPKNGK